jgi:hypothetical protein
VTIFKRILAEKRALILPLALAIVVNIGVYAFAVYPLGIRSEALRKTYTPVIEIARKANVTFLSQSQDRDEKEAQKTGLGRLHTRIVFQCSYENFRTFIYELESAPAFMIIDVVTLAQADQGKPLALTIEMSTYYHASTDGT